MQVFEAKLQDSLSQAGEFRINTSGALDISDFHSSAAVEPGQGPLCRRCKRLEDRVFDALRKTSTQALGGRRKGVQRKEKAPVLFRRQELTHTSKYKTLQASADQCDLCRLMYQTLVKNNDFKLVSNMIENYSSSDFNRNQPYDENGITDLEYLAHTKPVQFRLRIWPLKGSQPGSLCFGLRLRFSVFVMTRLDDSHVEIDELVMMHSSQGTSCRVQLVKSDGC